MNKIIAEKKLDNENVRAYTISEHDHEIYTLLIELADSRHMCERGADDLYLVGP